MLLTLINFVLIFIVSYWVCFTIKICTGTKMPHVYIEDCMYTYMHICICLKATSQTVGALTGSSMLSLFQYDPKTLIINPQYERLFLTARKIIPSVLQAMNKYLFWTLFCGQLAFYDNSSITTLVSTDRSSLP